MTGTGNNGVRASVVPFARQTCSTPTYREVDAPLVSISAAVSPHVSVELLRRQGGGMIGWRYRQDRHALFLFEQGILSCSGALGGRTISQPLRGERRLAFVAAGTSVDAMVEMPGACRYVVAFFDAEDLIGDDAALRRLGAPSSRVGFADATLTRALALLQREVNRADALSRLMLEGWAAQAWAMLHRRPESPHDGTALGGAGLRRVLERMREHLTEDIATADLAALVGLGPRQFSRRFRASMGTTPAQMLQTLRIERAAELLRSKDTSITEVAFLCGFSQPQHLATAFRRRFDITPSDYRGKFL
jgi:AraC-like DNA-binding protein